MDSAELQTKRIIQKLNYVHTQYISNGDDDDDDDDDDK
jgi:hypothetical protein